MEVLLSFNTTLVPRNELDSLTPQVQFDDGMAFEFQWKVNCTAACVLKDMPGASRNFVHGIDEIAGELQIDMSVVCLPERYPGGKNEARVGMYVNDTAGIVERVLDLAGYQPFKFFIQIAYLERVLAFSGFHREITEAGNWCMWELQCQRLSPYRVMELLSNQISQDSFKATITMDFNTK